MRISRPPGFVGPSLLCAVLALAVPSDGLAQQKAPRARSARKAAGKRKGPGTQPTPATPPGPVTPATPVTPPPPPPQSNLPTAAVRMECNDGQASPLCATVLDGAQRGMSAKYRVLPAEQLEALLNKEPSLRGCQRNECRLAIAEKLGVAQLLDIILQSHKGTMVLFDPAAKEISYDSQLKRDDAKQRRKVEEAVELMLAQQRRSVPVKLEILPGGTRVRIVSPSGSRDLTDAERDGQREFRLFIDTYTVHVEKPGYIQQDQPLTVTPPGAHLTVRLQRQLVKVQFEWSPPETEVYIDGQRIGGPDRIMELPEGPHDLEARAPRGSAYESKFQKLQVVTDMEPVRIALQRLTALHIEAPRGYTVSLDNKTIPPERLQEKGLVIEAAEPTVPGEHTVTATSWRGLQLTRHVSVVPRSTTIAELRAPSLAPGIVLGTLGIGALVSGGVLLGLDGDCTDRAGCVTVKDYRIPAGVLLGAGGAMLISGVIWFGYNAANHPAFHKPSAADSARAAANRPRLPLLPELVPTQAGVLTDAKF